MSGRFLALLATALLIASSTFASAHVGSYGHHRGHHLMRPTRPDVVVATPAERPTIYPAARKFLAFPYNYHETDGLSRNPNDCAVYGCIDNN